MAQPDNRGVEEFLQTHQINAETAAAMRELPLELQHSLVQSRPLIGNNMSVVLMARIRKAEAVIASAAAAPQGPPLETLQVGSNPPQAKPADVLPMQFGGESVLQTAGSPSAEQARPTDKTSLGLQVIPKSSPLEHVDAVMPQQCGGGNDASNTPHRTWDEVTQQQPGVSVKAKSCVTENSGIDGREANTGKGKGKTLEACGGKRITGTEDGGVSDSMWPDPTTGGEGNGQSPLLPRVVPAHSSKAGKMLPLPHVASPRPAVVKWKANGTGTGPTSEAHVVPPPPKRTSNSLEMGATPKNRAFEGTPPQSSATDSKGWSARPGSFLSMPAGPSTTGVATIPEVQRPGAIAMSNTHGIATPTAKQLAFAQTIPKNDSVRVQGPPPMAMHAVDLTGITGGKGGQPRRNEPVTGSGPIPGS